MAISCSRQNRLPNDSLTPTRLPRCARNDNSDFEKALREHSARLTFIRPVNIVPTCVSNEGILPPIFLYISSIRQSAGAVRTPSPADRRRQLTTQPAAIPTPVFMTRLIHKVDRGLDWVYRIFGYVCGSLLLLLGIYITYQVIVRKLGGPVLGNQELVGGYILAFAGTWAFSYSLRTGSHVRIDVLLPLFSRIHPYMRSAADWLALGSVGFFGLITAIKSWEEVAESKCIRTNSEGVCEPALANTYLIGNFLPELWMFQMIVAVGFTMLAFTSFQWMLSMILRGLLEIWHKNSGGDVADLAPEAEVMQEAASGV